MALSNSIILMLVFLAASVSLSTQHKHKHAHSHKPLSLSFPLTATRLSLRSPLSSSLVSKPGAMVRNTPSYNYRSAFKYSMALIVSLPIGTPPQSQPMVLDTGSQLSWIQCHKKKAPPTTLIDLSLAAALPPNPDFTLPISCDKNRVCHYSYFYADGTLAEGNLVREKFTFSKTVFTPPLILGCAQDTSDAQGILGMNQGRLSFTSQAKINKFSYCVPPRQNRNIPPPQGGFYLGQNPNSHMFRYINLLAPTDSQRRSPNFDPLAFTLPMTGIRIANKRLNISETVFRPDSGGSGQTMIDSGSEFTYLVDEAYSKLRANIVNLVGWKLKRGYVYEGALDMCFDGNVVDIGRSIGDLVFEFEIGTELVVKSERVLTDVGGGVHCLGIGRSDLLGAASNIIGNVHQQNYWVEYDLINKRVGLGKADCSRSVQ